MKTKYNLGFFLAWAVICVLYVVIRLNLIDIPLDRDEGVFGYTGQVILNHGLPYKDVLDHKPPLIFYIYAIALLIVPPTSSGIHIFLYCYNFLTLICLFFLAKVYFGSYSAGLWSAFVYAIFSASPAIQGFTASTEMFMLLPMTLGILFAVLSVRNKNIHYALLSGIFGAAAFWIKQTAAFSILFSIVYLVVGADRKANASLNLTKPVLAWLAGMVAVSLLIGFYFYYEGVFDEFIYWSFTHNLLYGGMVDAPASALLSFSLRNLFRENFLVIGVGLVGGIVAVASENKRGCSVLGFLLLSFLGALLGQGYAHYFAQIAPSLSLAAAFGISWLIKIAPSVPVARCITALITLLMIFVPLFANPQYYLETSSRKISQDFFESDLFPRSVEVAQYLKLHTNPDDRIFIVGSEPQILLYSQRKSASVFVIIYPLVAAYPRYREFQNRMYQEISSSLPACILTSDTHYSFLWDGKADLSRLIQLEQLFYGKFRFERKWEIDNQRAICLYRRIQDRTAAADQPGGRQH